MSEQIGTETKFTPGRNVMDSLDGLVGMRYEPGTSDSKRGPREGSRPLGGSVRRPDIRAGRAKGLAEIEKL